MTGESNDYGLNDTVGQSKLGVVVVTINYRCVHPAVPPVQHTHTHTHTHTLTAGPIAQLNRLS